MPPGPDETEQLLARLEADLADHQKVIEERLAREDHTRMRLEDQINSWTRRREQVESQLAKVTPERDRMAKRREHLLLNGAKGNFERAMLWSALGGLLVMGATIPFGAFAGRSEFFALLFGEGLAVGAGWLLIAWRERRDGER